MVERKDSGRSVDIETRSRKPSMQHAQAIAAAKLAQQQANQSRPQQHNDSKPERPQN
ncbi:hypothetical protein [Mycobacterium intracellulare]|uniref:hypothetical protein n=1 Tax=Mycobacterium intracellulare TaxID=1767 RepID=UPI000ACD8F01|nr:hypothetical protein [Mycobacterium intracellulare]